MPIETAADRAALFSEDETAEAALYTPPGGGPGQPCSVIYERGRLRASSGDAMMFEVATGEGGARAAYTAEAVFILRDQVPVVVAGGQLAIGTVVDGVFVAGPIVLKVVGRPDIDETGAVWFADVQKVAG